MLNDTKNISNKNPFKVPEDYFGNFKKDIMLQIATLEPTQPVPVRKINMWKRTVSWSAVAAVFLGVVFTLNTNLRNPQQIAQNTKGSQDILASSKTSDESDFFQYIEEQSTRGSFNETLFSDENIY